MQDFVENAEPPYRARLFIKNFDREDTEAKLLTYACFDFYYEIKFRPYLLAVLVHRSHKTCFLDLSLERHNLDVCIFSPTRIFLLQVTMKVNLVRIKKSQVRGNSHIEELDVQENLRRIVLVLKSICLRF